jgi:subtilisin family serine protease
MLNKRRSLAVSIGLCVAVCSAAMAGNPFKGLTTTEGGYHTWDSDLINVDAVSQTGHGVYVAVLDTGMVPNWRDYFPEARVATELGTGFDQPVSLRASQSDPCGIEVDVGQLQQTTWVGSTGSTHGTHVASTILGYTYYSNVDAAAGFPLPPIIVRGIAPDVTVIPVRVLSDHQVPALPKCADGDPHPAANSVFGTDAMVAAGIRYATDLKRAGYSPMVINMSLGGAELAQVEKDALDYAIANGVIVVAAAGNEDEAGMGFPGAYPPVISAGALGWIGEWLKPTDGLPRYRMWWLKDSDHVPPLLPGTGEVADPTRASDIYVTDFSSRELPGQELDVLAPGSWVRGPFPGSPGFNHLPWWSKGIGDLVGNNSGNFFYVGGTSMATPHTAAVAALIMQKNPNLTQAQVESILKSTALPLAASGSRNIFDFDHAATITWDTDCNGTPCDAVGAGVLQADAALSATPAP